MKTIAPNKQNTIKETKRPRHKPALMFNFLISSMLFLYFNKANTSFVNDFTLEIPVKFSSIITLEFAASSCARLDSLRIKRPKKTAIIAITGTVASIISDNFQDKNAKNIIPPTTITICLKNSAMVVRKVSCI